MPQQSQKQSALKLRIYHLVEKGSNGSKFNLIFDYAIMTLICLNIIAMILESEATFYSSNHKALYFFEAISIVIFSIEYLLRIYVADLTYKGIGRKKAVLKFMTSTYGIIDLLAIVPFLIPFLITIDLRFLRILRLTRLLRILKIDRYTRSFNIISSIMKEKKSELAVTGILAFLTLFIASFLMYEVEGSAQPEAFPNIFASFWWATATLTTVGYGDVYPVTGTGKFISGIIAVLGIGLIALPTGIIGAGFIEKIQKKRDLTCPHCGKTIVK